MANIGDLYVNLGVKGSEKTVGALGDVKKGMGDIKSISLEAKAAILATVYGLEQMTSSSLQLGNSLQNTSTLIGVSEQVLYRYGTAARAVGGTLEDVQGSFEKIFDLGAKIATGQSRPKGLEYINSILGPMGKAITQQEMEQDQEAVMQKLQTFALRKDVPLNRKYEALLSMVSKSTATDLEKGAFETKRLDKIKTPSEGEFKRLEKGSAAVEEVKIKVDKAFLDFTAKYGASLAANLDKLIPAMTQLITAILNLGDTIHAWKIVGATVGGVGEAIEGDAKVIDWAQNIWASGKKGEEAKSQAKYVWDAFKWWSTVGSKVLDTSRYGIEGNIPQPELKYLGVRPPVSNHPPIEHKTFSTTHINQKNEGVDFSDPTSVQNIDSMLQTCVRGSYANGQCK